MADEAETVERKKKSKVSEREVLGNDGKAQDEYIGAAGASLLALADDGLFVRVAELLVGQRRERGVETVDAGKCDGSPTWNRRRHRERRNIFSRSHPLRRRQISRPARFF